MSSDRRRRDRRENVSEVEEKPDWLMGEEENTDPRILDQRGEVVSGVLALAIFLAAVVGTSVVEPKAPERYDNMCFNATTPCAFEVARDEAEEDEESEE